MEPAPPPLHYLFPNKLHCIHSLDSCPELEVDDSLCSKQAGITLSHPKAVGPVLALAQC